MTTNEHPQQQYYDNSDESHAYQVAYASNTRGVSHSCSILSNCSPVTIGAAFFVPSAIFSCTEKEVRGTTVVIRLDRHVTLSLIAYAFAVADDCGWMTKAEADEADASMATRRDRRAISVQIAIENNESMEWARARNPQLFHYLALTQRDRRTPNCVECARCRYL